MTAIGAQPNGRPTLELKQLEQERADQMPARALCAFCPDWAHEGTAAECRAASVSHRARYHSDTTVVRRRRGHIRRFHAPEQGYRDEGLARGKEIAAMLKRRAEAA